MGPTCQSDKKKWDPHVSGSQSPLYAQTTTRQHLLLLSSSRQSFLLELSSPVGEGSGEGEGRRPVRGGARLLPLRASPPSPRSRRPPSPCALAGFPHILPLRSSRLLLKAAASSSPVANSPPPSAGKREGVGIRRRPHLALGLSYSGGSGSDDDDSCRDDLDDSPGLPGPSPAMGAETNDESMRGGRRRQGPRSARDRDWTLRHRCRHPQLRKGHREPLFVVRHPCRSPPFSCLLASRHPLCISPSICYHPRHSAIADLPSPPSPTVSPVATRRSLLYRRAPLVPGERRG